MFSYLNSAVQRDSIIFFGIQLEAFNLIGHLNAQFSSGQYDQELDVIALEEFLMSESLDDG